MSFDFHGNIASNAPQTATDYIVDAVKYTEFKKAVDKYGEYTYKSKHRFLTLDGNILTFDPIVPSLVAHGIPGSGIGEQSIPNCAITLPHIQTVNMLMELSDVIPDDLKIRMEYGDTWNLIKGGCGLTKQYWAYVSAKRGGAVIMPKEYCTECVMDFYGFITRKNYKHQYKMDINRFKKFYTLITDHYDGKFKFWTIDNNAEDFSYPTIKVYSHLIRYGMMLDNPKSDWVDLIGWMIDHYNPNFQFSHLFMVYLCDTLIMKYHIDPDLLYAKLSPLLAIKRNSIVKYTECRCIDEDTWDKDKRYNCVKTLFLLHDWDSSPEFLLHYLKTLHALLTR